MKHKVLGEPPTTINTHQSLIKFSVPPLKKLSTQFCSLIKTIAAAPLGSYNASVAVMASLSISFETCGTINTTVFQVFNNIEGKPFCITQSRSAATSLVSLIS